MSNLFETSTKYYRKSVKGKITEHYIDFMPHTGIFVRVESFDGQTVSYTRDGEYKSYLEYRWCIAVETIEGTLDVNRSNKVMCLIPNI